MATNEEIMLAIGNLQGVIGSTSKSVERIGNYLGEQTKQIAAISTSVALVQQIQVDMKNSMSTYTTDCTKDRASQDKRITAVEGFQGRQYKMASFLAILFSSLISGGILWWKKGP